MLGGWATLGLPAQAPDETLRLRMVEVQEITDWLDGLWQLKEQDAIDLDQAELHPWLLAAALRAGVPQEAKVPLPEIVDGKAALALSAWAEAVAGASASPKFVMRMTADQQLLCRVQGPDLRHPSESLLEQLQPWLSAEVLTNNELGIGAGVLCRGLRLGQVQQEDPVQTRA